MKTTERRHVTFPTSQTVGICECHAMNFLIILPVIEINTSCSDCLQGCLHESLLTKMHLMLIERLNSGNMKLRKVMLGNARMSKKSVLRPGWWRTTRSYGAEHGDVRLGEELVDFCTYHGDMLPVDRSLMTVKSLKGSVFNALPIYGMTRVELSANQDTEEFICLRAKTIKDEPRRHLHITTSPTGQTNR